MTTLQVLKRARALVERGWTRKASARDSSGKPIFPRDRRACRWCVSGAIFAVTPNTPWNYQTHTRLAIIKAIYGRTYCVPALVVWNDCQKSKHAVLAAIDKAIEEQSQ